MTPKEKAKELSDSFFKITWKDDVYSDFYWVDAKQCALIVADQFIKYTVSIYLTKDEEVDFTHSQYWQQVRKEIEQLP